MQITITGGSALPAVAQDGGRPVLLLGTRLANHDLFDWCRRLLDGRDDAPRLANFSASGMRRAWSASGTLAAVNAGWSLVVMMEDAQHIVAEPERYIGIARVLSFAARSSGARVALVQPPPWSGDPEEWNRLREAVVAAARASHAAVVPLGEAWRRALARDPALPLRCADGGVTDLGAYLAACAIARYVAGGAVEAAELPGVARTGIRLVHHAVEEAVADGRDMRCEAQEGK